MPKWIINTETPLVSRIAGVEDCSLPIDKPETMRKVIEKEYVKEAPVLREVMEGKTTLLNYVEPLVGELQNCRLLKRWKISVDHDSDYSKTVELLFQPGSFSTSRITVYYPVCEPIKVVGWFIGAAICLLLSFTTISASAALHSITMTLAGIFCLAVGLFCANAPFIEKRESARKLRSQAQRLDQLIRELYPK